MSQQIILTNQARDLIETYLDYAAELLLSGQSNSYTQTMVSQYGLASLAQILKDNPSETGYAEAQQKLAKELA